jgi:hypothetical protein
MHHRRNVSGGRILWVGNHLDCILNSSLFFAVFSITETSEPFNRFFTLNVFSHCQPSYSMLLSLFQVDM